MKKYIGFMILAGFVFSFSVAPIVKAENGEDDGVEVNSTTSIQISPEDNLKERPLGKPKFEDIKANMEKRQEDRKEFRTETKAEWEKNRGERQEDRKEFIEKIKTERKEFIDNLKTKRDAFIAELKTKKEEWKKAGAEKRAEFCRNAKEIVTRRFEAAISALEKHQSTAAEITAELKADGEDVTTIEASLSLSKQKLTDAKAKIASTKALVPEGGCENMTPEIFEKIKLGAREAKDLLKESHDALKSAIKEIRILKGEIRLEAKASVEVKTETNQ